MKGCLWTCVTWWTCAGTDTGWHEAVGSALDSVGIPSGRRRSECESFTHSNVGQVRVVLGRSLRSDKTVTCRELRRQLQLPIPCGRRVESVIKEAADQTMWQPKVAGCQ